MKPIIGLVGPSGSGKTTLIMEMLKRFPEKLAPFKSITSRAKRDEQDALFFDFVSQDEIRQREEEGRLVQVSEYAGNLYANDTEDLLSTLNDKAVIGAIVESGVKNFEAAGFNVITVKVIPKGSQQATPERQKADLERQDQLDDFDFEIVNDFSPGGLETAIEELSGAIEMVAE